MFVPRESRRAFLAFQSDGGELRLEVARCDGDGGARLRGERELVLFLAGNLVLLGEDLGGLAHHHFCHGAEEAVAVHAVDQFLVAKPIAPARAVEIIR